MDSGPTSDFISARLSRMQLYDSWLLLSAFLDLKTVLQHAPLLTPRLLGDYIPLQPGEASKAST